MRIKKYYIALIFMLLGMCVAHAQENRTEICIDFRVNSIVIDSEYSDNAARMQEMVEFLQNIRLDSTINLIPTARYYPMRLHCIDLYIQITSATGVFIPVAPLLLDVIEVRGPGCIIIHRMKSLWRNLLTRRPNLRM